YVTNEASVGVTASVAAQDGITLSATVRSIDLPAPASDDVQHTFAAESTSGADSGGTASIAGSFAMNLVALTTDAGVHTLQVDPINPVGGLSVLGTGNVVMTAGSSSSSSAKAKALQTGSGSTVGMGLSIALNLINDTVFSGVDPVANPTRGPPITG